jgi:TIR domain/FHA domain
MNMRHLQFDFFIAHAGPDVKAARALYRLLSKSHRVFLDAESLMPGDPWDEKLPRAQKQSRVTVVLVSACTDYAYYQREEIAQAIDLSRSEAGRHHVVPIYLSCPPAPPDIPYGLRRLNFLFMAKDNSFQDVVRRLIKTLRELELRAGPEADWRQATIAFKSPYEGNSQLTLYPGDTVTLGRLPDTGLVFNDPKVSRHHAQLRLWDKGLSITDLDSLNHTYVNGVEVHHALLGTHDSVQLGRTGPIITIVKAPLLDAKTEEETIGLELARFRGRVRARAG